MTEAIYCEKCGTEMIDPYTEDDMCMGMTCPKCGWGWVTTNQNHIVWDNTLYAIAIPAYPAPSIELIRLVSGALECSYLEARRRLQQPVTLPCRAIAARDLIQKLNTLGIPYTITPDFPHKLS